MGAMVEMSRAIRHVIEDHSTDRTLKGVPTDTLQEFVTILGAITTDATDELRARRRDALQPHAD